MRTIKTYRKVGVFYIAWGEDFSTPIQARTSRAPEKRVITTCLLIRAFTDEWKPAATSPISSLLR
jgi:hypothetical protein